MRKLAVYAKTVGDSWTRESLIFYEGKVIGNFDLEAVVEVGTTSAELAWCGTTQRTINNTSTSEASRVYHELEL